MLQQQRSLDRNGSREELQQQQQEPLPPLDSQQQQQLGSSGSLAGVNPSAVLKKTNRDVTRVVKIMKQNEPLVRRHFLSECYCS